MKKITNKEIIDKFEKLFNSYTDEEFSKIIGEEYKQIKLKDKKHPKWLNEIKSKKPSKDVSEFIFGETTKDEGKFTWTKYAYINKEDGSSQKDNSTDLNICNEILWAA